ncbi:hypothetical protein A2291_03825 [candidate division WOR-1 bacterium RIFOXYB2_FULL_42_35]|uniref:Aminomethyltransferase n=1 Tax=candidate division WOR-1 bacterium RIFOXYC2_FULL_41_25 TaxID=1802586 RepID=A0A1F4TL54_UNCSA|nr:MAG: hypothetical protein A2247_06035 [candidate division WOR-1 bacterium RIFOXYA2_FULL_41_14]OGC21950.1 MAG: hypothetical protein A2291_03825 [candidate division WOR-1 bacterium RIFOXYB2_FULL_42_35]OGC32783.1 MAG: hypothetical protein A2462_07080 [candidate division WOR-1 bacterium RIFOXYC2_FULL_41_25]OGC41341.1 MAG: hypothetical protein A2548_02055 [candidate division WOR-1 bacterium RIFOXYD2_FULL_41_8]
MLKTTPLIEEHKKLGAKVVPFAGWEMPVSYKGIIAEHNAVRTSVGIFDIGHMGLIKVVGDGAFDFLQKVTTNDVSKLALNQCQYSILCNEAGGAIDDVLVYKMPMYCLVVCNASNFDKVISWLSFQAKSFNNVSVGHYNEYSSLALQGPRAEELASKVLNVNLSDLKRNRTLWWRDIIISRTGYTGEDGFELMVSKKEVVKIWQMFIEAGVEPCGLGARDTLRLEAGLPLYGHEYDEETTPLEAGYSWAVKFDKGSFVGKEALLKEKESGLKKKLVGLAPEGRQIPRAGDNVFTGEDLIGKVTSGTFSPTLKKAVALAYLNPQEGQLGNSVEIEIRGKRIPAKVVAKTFYKR